MSSGGSWTEESSHHKGFTTDIANDEFITYCNNNSSLQALLCTADTCTESALTPISADTALCAAVTGAASNF